MLETSKSPGFCQGVTYVCWGTTSVLRKAGSLQFCLNLHCLLAQSFKAIQRWENRTSSGRSWAWTEPYIHLVFKIPGNMSELFKSTSEYLISQLVLLNFWLASCWPQLLSLPQAHVMLNNCCWLSLTIVPEEKADAAWECSESGHRRGSLVSWAFQETFREVKNNNYLRMMLLACSIPALSSLETGRLLIFTIILSGWFSKVLWH